MITVLVFIVALSVLIFVHEWGHFIIAKRSGVRVDVFSIGFGPRLFSFKWHNTEYRIAPIPFGGYVRIYGQEPLEEADGDIVKAEKIARDPDSFSSKPLYKRFGVVFAGPVMNLVLCFVLMPVVFFVGRMQPKILDEKPVVIDVTKNSPAEKAGFQKGDLILSMNGKQMSTWKELITQVSLYPDAEVEISYNRNNEIKSQKVLLTVNTNIKQTAGFLGIEPFEFYGNEPVVDLVTPGSPAEKAGIKSGDQIKSINGTPVTYWTQMTEIIQQIKGATISMTLLRGQTETTVSITPEFSQANNIWIVGITKKVDPNYFVNKKYGVVDSVVLGAQECVKLFSLTFEILGRLFTGDLSFKTLGGPLQIAKATSAAAKSGLGEFLYLVAFLSIQLGILNLLPIPILDGGHVVFMLIEGVRRKPLSHKIRAVSMQVGLVLLLGLMLLVTINDINTIWGIDKIVGSIKGLF